MIEKRQYKRLGLDVSIQLARLDDDRDSALKFVHVDVTDVSKSGIGFRSLKRLEVGSYYDTKIEIWTKEVVDAVVELIREEEMPDGSYKYGAIFIGLSNADALKIEIYQIFNDK